MGKNKREEYAAILAVGERGEAVVVKWLRQEEWMREAASMWDTLKETVFEEDAGFYYAKMVCSACGGDKCLGEPCDGGCRDVQWEIGERVDVACISEFQAGSDAHASEARGDQTASTFAVNKQKGNVTPCTKGFYPWVPANCQEVDGEFYFNIVWEDCEGGWKGRAMTGERLFHPADMNKTAVIVPKGG